MLGARNQQGLTERQIEQCRLAWELLCAGVSRPFDVSEAHQYGSRTRFNETRGVVFLGADVLPGDGPTANARLSLLACLTHELAHWERFEAGYNRPFDMPHNLLDEAETSIRASFHPVLYDVDRECLVEDARDRLIDWIAYTAEHRGEEDA